MRVMTSQDETSGKNHIYSVEAQNPEYDIYPLEKKNSGKSSILAQGISRVLPTDPLFTLC